MWNTKKQATELVEALEEAFRSRDPKKLAAVHSSIAAGGAWGGGTPVGDVVSWVVKVHNEAIKQAPESWPPPMAGLPRYHLDLVPEDPAPPA